MQLIMGMEPVKVELPGDQGFYVKLRRLKRRERRAYQTAAEPSEYLLEHMVTDFLLPSPKGQVRFNPDDTAEGRKFNEDALDQVDEELEEWLVARCFEVAGEAWRLRMVELIRADLKQAEDEERELSAAEVERIRREAMKRARAESVEETILGN